MRLMSMPLGAWARIDVDPSQFGNNPLRFYDGPIQSPLILPFGSLEPPVEFYGKVWTGGPHVTIRYHAARPKGREPIPVCMEARYEGDLPLKKHPDSQPGIALVPDDRLIFAFVVESFR
jgi:hypothetical protein